MIDFADERKNENIQVVNQVLEEIGAADIPTLLIYNKVDKLDGIQPFVERDDEGKVTAVYLSAQSGEGIDLLFEAIRERLRNELVKETLLLSPTAGNLYTLFNKKGLKPSISMSLAIALLILKSIKFNGTNGRSNILN